MHKPLPLTRKDVFAQAWPILLSQASMPLVGLVDTAIIGQTGDTIELAGVALGASVIGFIFWSFGFLRMGVTGLTAQSFGKNDELETQSVLIRALILGGLIGAGLFLLQFVFISGAYQILQASSAVETSAADYSSARFLGAPAALASYAINGWLLGQGKSGQALLLQIIVNSTNIIFDTYFVLGLNMGAEGVGYGTAAAEWCSVITGSFICFYIIQKNGGTASGLWKRSNLLSPDRLKEMFSVNGNIMVRTMALLGLMTWFANSGARQGDSFLAANHVLMQLLAVSAYVLDAFAVTAESRVGAAYSVGSKKQFWTAIRLTTEFAVAGAIICSLLILSAGATYIQLMVQEPNVQQIATTYLPMVALAPILGVASWQLDGIFIGTTQSAAMRTSTILTLIIYIGLDILFRPLGNWGVWIAFCVSYILRAITLGAYMPRLIRRIEMLSRSEDVKAI